MRTVKFETEPFTCPSCVKKIEGVVGRVEGVASAQVLFNSNKVKVAFDEEAVSAESLAQTITDLGYPVVSSKAALPASAS